MIAFRRLIPQSSVDNADNAGVCEIADQSPDALLELDNHFGNADIHQGMVFVNVSGQHILISLSTKGQSYFLAISSAFTSSASK